MTKKTDTKDDDDDDKRNVNIENFMSAAMLTPLVHPVRHRGPADAGVIWGIPTNLIGLSGLGKSDRVKDIGAAIGLPVYSVYAATKQPTDFTGLAVPTPNGIIIECILPAARHCIEHGRGLIFFDEASCTSPRTQAALLSVVNERQVGDHLLPPKTRMVLAMNPAEYAAAGHDLEPPMANRLAHVWCRAPTRDEWCYWLQGGKPKVINVDRGEAMVIQNWDKHWPTLVGMAVGFMRSGIDKDLHDQPKPSEELSGAAWPSPRTTWMALSGIATCRCLNLPVQTEFDILDSLVGPGVAAKWIEWMRHADLPDPLTMLTKGWTPDRHRLDRTYAAMTAMTQYLKTRQRPEAVQFAPAAWTIIKDSYKAGLGDISASSAQMLVQTKLGIHGADLPETLKVLAADVIYLLTEGGYVSQVT